VNQLGDYHISVWILLSRICIKLNYSFIQAMLEINDHMHDVWKRRDEDKSIRTVDGTGSKESGARGELEVRNPAAAAPASATSQPHGGHVAGVCPPPAAAG
jgi:hypothetical protein